VNKLSFLCCFVSLLSLLRQCRIKFKFNSPVCEGGAPGKGDSSFFRGLVSKTPPQFVTAALHEPGGVTHSVKARSPK